MSAPRQLALDFYFDLVCPWCWIGLRQLDAAQQRLRATHPQLELQVRWRSFPLLPQLPKQGLPYQEFYLRRLGGAAAVAARRAQVQAAGQGIVPPFQFERIGSMPNTVLAHRMLDFVRAQARPAPMAALLEDLYAAYFTAGRDIGDADTLCALAAPYVEDGAALRAWLDDEPAWQAAQARALAAPDGQAVGGVPCLALAGQAPLGGVTSTDYLHYWLAQGARA